MCEPLPAGLTLFHVLVVPNARLSTREIYESEGFSLTASAPSITMMRHAFSNGSLGELAKGLWNDLEPEAIRRCPVITLIQSRLQDLGCLAERISGSGPSAFGLCHDLVHAHEIAARLRSATSQPWRIEIIQTEHPSL